MRRNFVALAAALLLPAACTSTNQGPAVRRDATSEMPSRVYSCMHSASAIVIDGRLDDDGWSRATWSEMFVDISGPAQPAPRFATRMKMAWDDENLYIGALLEEPHVWATLRQRDEIVFHDNDFEIFIDPDSDGRNYFEIEINALGTIFDLLLVRKYRDGGPALHDWTAEGMRSAVHIDGTLNEFGDEDRSWSVEFALPWVVFKRYTEGRCPPAVGDRWSINFSRVEWRHDVVDGQYRKRPGLPEDNWVWRPTGEVDMHLPEKWGYVVFQR